MEKLVKDIYIPQEYRKKTTIASNLFYDKISIFENKIVGYLNNSPKMTWYFKEYSGIDIVKANLNSQFASIVFLTGINSRNRVVGVDLLSTQNALSMNDTNRILLCSGMFSFKKTNDYAHMVGEEIRKAFDCYKNNDVVEVSSPHSTADEILKFKELFDTGVITQEEFEEKRNSF